LKARSEILWATVLGLPMGKLLGKLKATESVLHCLLECLLAAESGIELVSLSGSVLGAQTVLV
jgi:hypothetical protein